MLKKACYEKIKKKKKKISFLSPYEILWPCLFNHNVGTLSVCKHKGNSLQTVLALPLFYTLLLKVKLALNCNIWQSCLRFVHLKYGLHCKFYKSFSRFLKLLFYLTLQSIQLPLKEIGAYWKVLGFIQTYFANLITFIKPKFFFFVNH